MSFHKTSLEAFAETIRDPTLQKEFQARVATIKFHESKELGGLICWGGAVPEAFIGSSCQELANHFVNRAFADFIPENLLKNGEFRTLYDGSLEFIHNNPVVPGEEKYIN